VVFDESDRLGTHLGVIAWGGNDLGNHLIVDGNLEDVTEPFEGQGEVVGGGVGVENDFVFV
tara:strand:- start:319 stop:501 length:183 start_codon:yes stop_codon:yes gene_type:complete